MTTEYQIQKATTNLRNTKRKTNWKARGKKTIVIAESMITIRISNLEVPRENLKDAEYVGKDGLHLEIDVCSRL